MDIFVYFMLLFISLCLILFGSFLRMKALAGIAGVMLIVLGIFVITNGLTYVSGIVVVG